jgi:hypothetical protein
VCVAPTELISTLKELLAAQSAGQAALLGAVKSGMQARDKDASPDFNWLLTYTGRDVAAVIKVTVEALLPGKGWACMCMALVPGYAGGLLGSCAWSRYGCCCWSCLARLLLWAWHWCFRSVAARGSALVVTFAVVPLLPCQWGCSCLIPAMPDPAIAVALGFAA